MIDDQIIINHMLSTIGEGGVSTLNTLHPSVTAAKRIVDVQNVLLQSRGWWFNKERNLKLAVDDNGRVEVPADALDIIVSAVEDNTSVEKLRYVKRGLFIYDTYMHTNVINRPITIDMIVKLPIEDMPVVAGNYLLHTCAVVAYTADDGDEQKTERLERRRAEAWQILKETELATTATNALDNPMSQALRNYPGGFDNIYGGGQR